MTIEEFIGLSADDFARMSDDEIMAHLQPYLASMRPAEGKKFATKEQIATKQRSSGRANMMNMINKWIEKNGDVI